jgi:hypothetical protein
MHDLLALFLHFLTSLARLLGPGGTLRNFTWEKHCGGLFELPVAA